MTVMNLVVSHWSANAAVVAVCAAAAAAHLLGMRAIAAGPDSASRPGRTAMAREAIAFYCGLLVVVAAFVSPLGYWAQHHIWARSIQGLLVAEVAPALIVMGAPWPALARALRLGRPLAAAGGQAGQARSPRPAAPSRGARQAWSGGRRRTWLGVPLAVVVAYNASWWFMQLPPVYDAALRSVWAYGAQAVICLGLGVAFWLQLIGSGRFTPKFPPLRRVILVAGTVVSVTVLGMALGFSTGLIYPAYQGPDGSLAGALADQQLGGAIVWVLSLPPFVVAAVAILARWLKNEETEALAAGLDRLLETRTSAWPSRPGL